MEPPPPRFAPSQARERKGFPWLPKDLTILVSTALPSAKAKGLPLSLFDQFCWAHIIRNLQKMADYSGKGLTAHIGQQLVLICQSVFRTQHRYEDNKLTADQYQKRMRRLRKSFNLLLQKGMTTPCKRYV